MPLQVPDLMSPTPVDHVPLVLRDIGAPAAVHPCAACLRLLPAGRTGPPLRRPQLPPLPLPCLPIALCAADPRKLVVAQADARTLVDGREIYTAKDLRVGLFTSTESF